MESDGVWALIGAVALAFVIRVFNMVADWLSRVLGVDPPTPIPTIQEAHKAASSVDQPGTGAVPSPVTPEAPSSAAPEHPETPSAPS